jgi:hemerythrin-like metal-binding protein
MRNLIEWSDSSSVGIGELDDQHKTIFDIINRLFERMHNAQTKDDAAGILEELKDYSKVHFAAEEKLFGLYGYPEKEEHEKAHRQYDEKILSLEADLEDKKGFLSFDILDFLENWWLGHITNMDKKYSGFLQGKGLH